MNREILYTNPEVGDLVTLKSYCRNSGKMAIVTEILSYTTEKVKIHYFEPDDKGDIGGVAAVVNLLRWEDKDKG